eukprot:scaffold7080_cov302-Pinguiococcus_pyrenoidosus.AAC.2
MLEVARRDPAPLNAGTPIASRAPLTLLVGRAAPHQARNGREDSCGAGHARLRRARRPPGGALQPVR